MTVISRNVRSNLVNAILAQGMSFALSIIIALVVPKVLGVEAYSYWQLFVFYSSFSGLFLFGLNDGLYLVYGGEEREELDQAEICMHFKVSILVQIVIAAVILSVSLFSSFNAERKIILFFLAIYILLFNAVGFWGSVLQAINETRLYSRAIIASKIFSIVCLIPLILCSVDSFIPYIVVSLAAQCVSFCYIIYTCREFLRFFGSKISFCRSCSFCKIGIKLTIANISSMLIIGLARAVIDTNWGIIEFGKISLSLSVVNFLLMFLSQVGMVLFPALRSSKDINIAETYRKLSDICDICLPFAYLLYFPISSLLLLWLPQYSESFVYLGVLLPICVFDGKMQMVIATYLKVLRMENKLLFVNLACMILSVVFSCIGAFCFNNLWIVLAGMVVSVMFRNILASLFLARNFQQNNFESVACQILLGAAFMLGAIYIHGSLFPMLVIMAISTLLFMRRKIIKASISAILNKSTQ